MLFCCREWMKMPLRKSSTHWRWTLSTVSSCSVVMSWNWVLDSEQWSAMAGWVTSYTVRLISWVTVTSKDVSSRFYTKKRTDSVLFGTNTFRVKVLSCNVFPVVFTEGFLSTAKSAWCLFLKGHRWNRLHHVYVLVWLSVCIELMTDISAAVMLTTTDEEASL